MIPAAAQTLSAWNSDFFFAFTLLVDFQDPLTSVTITILVLRFLFAVLNPASFHKYVSISEARQLVGRNSLSSLSRAASGFSFSPNTARPPHR